MKKIAMISTMLVLAAYIVGCGSGTEENTTSKPVDASTKAGAKTNTGPAGATMD